MFVNLEENLLSIVVEETVRKVSGLKHLFLISNDSLASLGSAVWFFCWSLVGLL